jgi:protein gp37
MALTTPLRARSAGYVGGQVKATRIGWAESTWNPFTGCSKVSPDCDHCHAERIRGGAFPRGCEPTFKPAKLADPGTSGVWGGTTERQRTALRGQMVA